MKDNYLYTLIKGSPMKKSTPIILILFAIVVIIGALAIYTTSAEHEKNCIKINGTEVTFEQEIDDGQIEMQLIVKSPESCVIGEMVTIDATASNCDTFEWKVIPATDDFRVITNGQEALFCARAPGTYIFILAGTRDGILMPLKAITIIVEQGVTPVVIVENTFTIKVKSWLPQGADPKILEQLARSFERVASATHADVASLVKTTALSNRSALGANLPQYKPFLIAFSAHLKTNLTESTIDEHVELWFNMAKILREIK